MNRILKAQSTRVGDLYSVTKRFHYNNASNVQHKLQLTFNKTQYKNTGNTGQFTYLSLYKPNNLPTYPFVTYITHSLFLS
jgi:hypothetical protein